MAAVDLSANFVAWYSDCLELKLWEVTKKYNVLARLSTNKDNTNHAKTLARQTHYTG